MVLLLSVLLACDGGPSGLDGTTGGDGGTVGDGGATDGDGGTTDGAWSDGDDGELVSAARADLRLKRWRQVSLDLEGGLEIAADEVCREAGLYDCTDIHVVPMGGVSVPNGLYRPIDTISATTGLATERMVLQACWNRGKKDAELLAEGSAPVVFGHIDLEGDVLDGDAATAQVSELYRRLLARDPLADEVTAVVGLHEAVLATGGANADWALLACFSIGTTTEALTY